MKKRELSIVAITFMVFLVAALVTGCGDNKADFTVEIKPSHSATTWESTNWSGTIHVYRADPYKEDETIEISGSGPKTYQVNAEHICCWAGSDYGTSFEYSGVTINIYKGDKLVDSDSSGKAGTQVVACGWK